MCAIPALYRIYALNLSKLLHLQVTLAVSLPFHVQWSIECSVTYLVVGMLITKCDNFLIFCQRKWQMYVSVLQKCVLKISPALYRIYVVLRY